MSIIEEQRAPRLVQRLRRYFPQVDRVVDAKKPVKINVTESDVTGAKKMKHDACAMAKACQRQERADGALIRPTVSFLIHGNIAVKYETPESVAREIVSFDRHGDFRPGEYQLSAVFKCHRQGARKTNHKRGQKTGTVKHRPPLVSRRTEGIRGVGVTPKD